MGGDPSGILRSWIHDFFETTWANAVAMAIWLLASVWLWFGVVPSEERPVPRPLDWYSQQTATMEWQVPRWFDQIAEWHSPNGVWWPQAAIMLAAIMLSVQSATKFALGYRVGAAILLIMSMQWFGVSATVLTYVISIVVLSALAILVGKINRMRRPDDLGQHYSYSPGDVLRSVISGPAYVLFMPVVLPAAALLLTIRSMGFEQSKFSDPAEQTAITEALDLASTEPGSATRLSARELGIILATSQLAAHSNSEIRQTVARRIHTHHQQQAARPIVVDAASPQFGYHLPAVPAFTHEA